MLKIFNEIKKDFNKLKKGGSNGGSNGIIYYLCGEL